MLPPHAPPDPDAKTDTGVHKTLTPGSPSTPAPATPAQRAGLRPPVPGEKPPTKKH